jgi:hypothetical protein
MKLFRIITTWIEVLWLRRKVRQMKREMTRLAVRVAFVESGRELVHR